MRKPADHTRATFTHVMTGYSQSDADYANPNGSPPPLLYDVQTYRPRAYGIDVLYQAHWRAVRADMVREAPNGP
ncbi:MAG TPA: hypothetical protein VGN43_10350 [Steroidobacteraceae bacterium]|nr:hypothetical protein [Steroidobacteraceae bacterium]